MNPGGEIDGRGGWRRIFFGPHGLRAGWSVLIFAAVGVAVEAGSGSW